MNDDIKRMLDDACQVAPLAPAGSVEAAIVKGRSIRRRRRVLAAGGLTATAGIGVATLVLAAAFSGAAAESGGPGHGGGGTASAPAEEPSEESKYDKEQLDEQPEYPLPDADEGRYYDFGPSDFEANEDAEYFETVFWDYMEQEHPEFVPVQDEQVFERGNYSLSVFDQEMPLDGPDDFEATGYSKPVITFDTHYGSWGWGQDGYEPSDPDEELSDAINIEIHPPESYVVGYSEKRHDLGYIADCASWDNEVNETEIHYQITYEFDCAESTAPTGEAMVEMYKESNDVNVGTMDTTDSVVFFAENGLAVKVGNTAPTIDGEPTGPTLSNDDMTAIAAELAYSGGIVQ